MSERQYPWDVLEIDETNDKKSIKKAYAALLKQHKPDENPEKFQEIQEAYEYALQQLNISTLNHTYVINKPTTSEYNNIDEINSNTSKELDTHDENDNRIYKTLIKNVKKLMGAELILRSNIEAWKFIDEYHNLNNLYLKKEVAEEVFKICSKANIEFFNRNKKLKLTNNIMVYLYDTFDWNSKWNEYSDVFDEEAMSIMTCYQESDSKDIINSIEEFQIMKRIKIFKLECSISYIFAVIFYFILDLSFIETLKLTIYFILFIRVGFEILFKTTILSLGANIYTTDVEGNVCNRSKILVKHVILALLFLPVYNFIFALNINNYLLISIFLLFVIINSITLATKTKFLHDVITNTIVVEKKGIFED